MARQKEYWNDYTEHCIRHPYDHVSYITFRQRCAKWGKKLAIRLGKLEAAPKMDEKFKEKRNGFLRQKRAQKKKQKWLLIGRILLGILLFGLGVITGTML